MDINDLFQRLDYYGPFSFFFKKYTLDSNVD